MHEIIIPAWKSPARKGRVRNFLFRHQILSLFDPLTDSPSFFFISGTRFKHVYMMWHEVTATRPVQLYVFTLLCRQILIRRTAAVKEVAEAMIMKTERVGLRTCEYKYKEEEGGRRWRARGIGGGKWNCNFFLYRWPFSHFFAKVWETLRRAFK